MALSTRTESLTPVVKALEDVAAGRPKAPTWEVVIVPPSIVVAKEECELRDRQAERLAAVLGRVDEGKVAAAVATA